MAKSYYTAPVVPKTRVVHWYDLIITVAVIVILIVVAPLSFEKETMFSFSDGMLYKMNAELEEQEKLQEEKIQKENEVKLQTAKNTFTEGKVAKGYFDKQFENGNIFTGAYAYTTETQGEYIVYRDGYERVEYVDGEEYHIENLSKEKGPVVQDLIIYLDGNRVLFETLDKSIVPVERNVDELIYKDGKPDYEKVYSILTKNSVGEISYEEAATVIAFIEKDILVGYYNGSAWFFENYDEESNVLKEYADGEVKYTTGIPKSDVAPPMVIQNKYAIVEKDGQLLFGNIEDNASILYRMVEGEELNFYTYIVDETDGVVIFAVSDKYITKMRPLGKGTECEFSEKITCGFSVKLLSTVDSTHKGKYMLWSIGKKDIHWYLYL